MFTRRTSVLTMCTAPSCSLLQRVNSLPLMHTACIEEASWIPCNSHIQHLRILWRSAEARCRGLCSNPSRGVQRGSRRTWW